MRLLGITFLAALTAIMVLAAPSQARDRNHDHIPDRWERAHHLSLRVHQNRRDQDHDGLKNRAEFLAQTDPHNADSDGDGIPDGNEQAGKVASFTGGVLTIDLFGGGSISGKVTPDTEIQCDSGDDNANQGDHEGDDGQHSDRAVFRDDQGDQGDQGENDQGDDDQGDQGDDHVACPAGALAPGAIVQEAELELTNGSAVFVDIELVS
jgi:Bacterial TSP3 repeat